MYASIILPTYNEAGSLPRAIAALRNAMADRDDWEVIVVDDDSPDGTWALAQQMGLEDSRIRCYRRLDRRGLSSAIVDGLSLGTGERLLVMDADLQHDASKVPELLAALDDAAVSVGSRYTRGGGVGEWSRSRQLLSRVASWSARLVLGLRSTDPMSGFFAVRRETFLQVATELNPRGYKLLMELLALLKGRRVAEVPYVFSPRQAGESKLSGGVIWEFFLSLVELSTRNLISARFLKYALVGVSGVGVQYGSFYLLWSRVLTPEQGTFVAIATAAVSNYVVNNAWTFAERRHKTLRDLARGFTLFVAISACGAFINQSVTWYLEHLEHGQRHIRLVRIPVVVQAQWRQPGEHGQQRDEPRRPARPARPAGFIRDEHDPSR
jgi:dolichol-phosphate mannosyltransferase